MASPLPPRIEEQSLSALGHRARSPRFQPSKDATPFHDDLDDYDIPISPIEGLEQKQKDIESSQSLNNPRNDYGSTIIDAGSAGTIILEDAKTSPIGNTNNLNNGLSHPASDNVSPAAIIVPIFIVLILLTGLTYFFRPCTSLRSRKKSPTAAALASDLETGAVPPPVLSPSVVPAQEPREHQRGWLFMPQLGVPNWIRGYRRRSDPRHADDPDWQLDVNEVGEAPPEYTGPIPEEKREMEANMMQRSATNATTATTETLPGYQALEEAQVSRQYEVHSREAAGGTEQRSDDVTEGNQASVEKSAD